jgi:hypothetical protein
MAKFLSKIREKKICNNNDILLSFIVDTNLCGSWPPPWFLKRKCFRSEVVKLYAQPPTRRTWDYPSPGPYPFTCLAWMTLSGAYAPASIALRVTGAHKPPHHDKEVNLEEE